MAEPSAAFVLEMAKFFAQAAVVVIGWWVVNRLTQSREQEKARKDMASKECDALSVLVDSFFAKSYEYHTTGRRVRSELLMKMEITDISYRLSNLNKLSIPPGTISALLTTLIRLKIAATGNHFEDEHMGAMNQEAVELADLAEASISLKSQLIEVKSALFA